ncbi:MAG: hypothetical protein ACFFCW_03155, partial [Candidatus Hodarchaeota archaeon]
MKVVYITMCFPTLTETFACDDVLALKRMGMNVSVHGLRPKPKYFKRLVKERGLETLLITHNTMRASLRGLLFAVKRPAIASSLLLFTLRYAYRTLNFLLRSIVFIP